MKRILITITVGVITLLAVVVFVRTLVSASVSVSNSGSMGSVMSSAMLQNMIQNPVHDLSASIVGKNTKSGMRPRLVSDSNLPARLIIPSINVDANVQKVGLTANGAMGTPSNFTDVGWYSFGTIPGNNGSAVIDGHVDNGLGLSGVFKNLTNLKIGDEVDVVNVSGRKIRFIISNIESYPYDTAPNQSIFHETGGSYLKLITCEGNWIGIGRTYDQRLVVTATKI